MPTFFHGWRRKAAYVLLMMAVYALMVCAALTVNAWWKSRLGLTFERGEVLQCICGPAITIASTGLIWLGILGIMKGLGVPKKEQKSTATKDGSVGWWR